MFIFVKGTIKSGFGIKCSHAGHTFTHRLMAAIHSGDRYPYSCVVIDPGGLSPPVGDYYPFRGQGIIIRERELSFLFVA